MNTTEILTEKVKERGVTNIILEYKQSMETYDKYQKCLNLIEKNIFYTIEYDIIYDTYKSSRIWYGNHSLKMTTYNYNSFLSMLGFPSTTKRYLKITSRIDTYNRDTIFGIYYIHEDFVSYENDFVMENVVFISGFETRDD